MIGSVFMRILTLVYHRTCNRTFSKKSDDTACESQTDTAQIVFLFGYFWQIAHVVDDA